MGNQGHSSASTFMIREWIDSGAIGEVRRVDCWNNTSYSNRGWPKSSPPVPETLDWDLWVGNAAFRPYNPGCIKRFYGWPDFGTGTIGAWGTHTLDASFWGLQLGAPTSVEAKATSDHPAGAFPYGVMIEFNYPARGDMPPVTVAMYMGKMSADMARPKHLEAARKLAPKGGQVIIGSKASILAGRWCESARIIPETKMQEIGKPPKKYDRPIGGHFGSWINACKDGGKPATSNFDYAGPFTEMCLLGVIASLCPGKKLLWDSAKMKITNDEEANKLVRRQYRKGWKI
ncbi:MAG: hypothetical protein DRP64_18270 [Verrucomicrobia bacterium]|nr:MAG: hypothetical protein DRP64_18270 [Verrucomicrobiota bacterium]